MGNLDAFVGSAEAVAALLTQVRDWSAPALGGWEVRALAGHTSRAVTTPVEYLGAGTDRPPEVDAVGYLAAVRSATADLHPAVAARGVEAGQALGAQPAARFADLVAEARAVLTDAGDPVVPTVFGPMRLEDYLLTRTFELVVHGSDLAAATGLDLNLPTAAMDQVAHLVTAVALRHGQGVALARVLTGRDGSEFTIL